MIKPFTSNIQTPLSEVNIMRDSQLSSEDICLLRHRGFPVVIYCSDQQRGGGYTPQKFKYCMKVGPKIIVELLNYKKLVIKQSNFLLKYNKFAKILAEINAQITGNGLGRVPQLKNYLGDNSRGPPSPIQNDYVLASVATTTSVHN